MKRFADRLREARVAAGMTQEQLGFALGITKSSVSAWENGRETPSFRMLPELRRELGRSLDELICGVPPEAGGIEEGRPKYASHEASPAARDEKERALLLRYRSLSAKRRAALLDLLKAEK
ncbi:MULTISPECIES: helix-turn-helix transcriptional regulator [unclassified Rhodanobacter]|uniref:helix-turn-helix domain-containing protein n=1 Tax=unclassified Rhodanobacter TaxID=2621553 RepID=UPI001BDDD560|nr:MULTISPECIES: helix-turn-helix transcriptional regulator [unclassified Rhodanobacter]MBT2143965.1 helix-turn-helix transcriptional regulator [Rhodanobacter sp. LX-99]MBT2146961.1 helix-turn-helix transcriptional regulator [Rhodanobacter sp. LX-100]